MTDFKALFPTATDDEIAELRPSLVDVEEPSDALCDQYWNILKVNDPDQEGISDLRSVHKACKVNHRRGYHIRIKLASQGRITQTAITSGQGKRQRTTGAVYVWTDPSPAPAPVAGGGE